LVLVDLAASAALKYCGPSDTVFGIVNACLMGWMVAALLVGCASIAEERQSHTHESAVCLPVGRIPQFLVKLAVVFGLGIFLGAIMPWLLAHLRPEGQYSLATVSALKGLLLAAAITTAVGCYASSLSRTLLQAFGVAILLAMLPFFAGIVLGFLLIALEKVWWFVTGRMPNDLRIDPLLNWAFDKHPFFSWSALIALLMCLGYGNFKQLRIEWRKWFRVGLIALAVILLLLILSWISSFILYTIHPLPPYWR
jgi:hypothetical protein